MQMPSQPRADACTPPPTGAVPAGRTSLSLNTTRQVWLSALPKGANKLVLLCFCQHLNDGSALSWPSIARVATMCGMSERTVQCHIRALVCAGILIPRLRTGRTTRYAVALSGLQALAFETDTVVLSSAPELFEAVDNFEAPAEIVDNLAPTPATFALNLSEVAPQPAENDTKPVEICTLTVDGTPIELKGTEDGAPALPATLLMFDQVAPQVRADFAAIRKQKRKGAVTATELEDLCQQAALAGLTLEQTLRTCCVRKWARFEAAWFVDSQTARPALFAVTTPAPATPPQPRTVLAAPEVAAAGRQRLSLIRSTPPAPPVPVAGIQIGATGPGWAHTIVNKHRQGQHVGHAALKDACIALKITPASLSAARLH
ncbi:hypothetical protein RCH06_001838 [Polaromonas sp. CG_9.5]|uniref:helix-turn-helix domain-containing protein n=1 Tax=Polaromonas sp. CG_9.5 TaxID=3071705 RepID=UPI002E05E441|nr:hypothetical protein [Polaromonas sp. CG_9.5]